MRAESDWLTLQRDCTATTVPWGERVELSTGGEIRVIQQLGGSATVETAMGMLLRVDAEDLDALGLDRPADPTDNPNRDPDAPFTLDSVYAALDEVYDPEIPLSIVELGLVYRCEAEVDDAGLRTVEIDMTMTAPGCGMGEVLQTDAARAVAAVPGVDRVEVNLVWEPRWSMQHMSDAARLQLGLL